MAKGSTGAFGSGGTSCWQNRFTSGWQASRSSALPGSFGAAGCGGNCAYAAVAAAIVKAIVKLVMRSMVPFPGLWGPPLSITDYPTLRRCGTRSERRPAWISPTRRKKVAPAFSVSPLAPSRRRAIHLAARAVSSVGRASALHAECRRFEPVTAHHTPKTVSEYKAARLTGTHVSRSQAGVEMLQAIDPRELRRREQLAHSETGQMASLSSFEARKATFLLALIWMASPVAGLRPMRAARFRT
jgi:hypothetical protein